MNRILGIDPGASGALALYDPVTSDLDIIDMPTYKALVNGTKKKRIDLYALARWIDLHSRSIKFAVVEDPHAMPGQGVSSSFAFGFSCGAAQMLVASALIPVTLVRPAIWKRRMGLSSDKNASRALASLRFPQHRVLFARAKDDGRAEAALLALYGSELK